MYKKLSRVSIIKTRKNFKLNLVLVVFLVLESKVLWYLSTKFYPKICILLNSYAISKQLLPPSNKYNHYL